MAALGENSITMTKLAGSQVWDQLRSTLGAVARILPPSMDRVRPIVESVQTTKLMSSFSNAMDRVVPPYHSVPASLSENSISGMTSVAAIPMMDHSTKTPWTVAEALPPPMAAANPITKPMSRFTDAMDRLVPSNHKSVAAALAGNSRYRMASLAGDTLKDQLTKTLGTIAEVSSPSMARANRIAESSQITRSLSPLTGAMDRLAPSYHKGVATALGENSISGMASLRCSADPYQVPRILNVPTFGRTAKTVEDTSLVDTPSTSRADKSFFSATFEVFVPSRPIPTRPRHRDDSFQVMPKVILWEIERTLRTFLERQLRGMYGDKWHEQSVPRDILKRWTFRQEKDRNEGRWRNSLIDYSDFMDLLIVITESRNWDDLFEAFFENKEDISVSFRRLAPIRNSIAHNRQLGEADQITLIGEAHRILCRLGYRILFLS